MNAAKFGLLFLLALFAVMLVCDLAHSIRMERENANFVVPGTYEDEIR